MIRLADYVIKYLEDIGIKDIFTVPGGGSVFLNDALNINQNMNYYCCHHEQAVAMATEAYARVKNNIGVSLVTTGPGGTNAITGVAGSWTDSVPHLVISGQVFLNQTIRESGVRQFGVQEINIIDLVKPITKYAIMITDSNKIKYYLQKAIYIAKTGRPGPVWLDIPANIQLAQIDENNLIEFEPSELPELKYEEKLTEKVAHIVDLLKQSKRPLLHIGQGVKLSGAVDEFLKIVNNYNLPFVTARNANDIINSDDPLYVGRPGTFAQRGANFAVQNSDFYLAIGTRLTYPQTGYDSKDYARNAVKVMVDIDSAELNKDSLDIDIKIHIDAKIFLQELLKQLEIAFNTNWSDKQNWIKQCRLWKEKYPVNLPEYKYINNGINSFYFIDKLSDLLSSKDIIVTDMGFSFQTTHMGFKIKKGQKLFTNSGFASMGWGLPAAVGACIANNKQQVICITGEGGLQMNLQEFATVAHHKLPIKIFVYSNGGYLTMKQTFEDKFDGRIMGSDKKSGISFPDINKVAEAHGIKTIKITKQSDLQTVINEVLDYQGPIVIDLDMVKNQDQTPKFLARTNAEGKTLPTPIEDLFPFLPKEEFDENMIVNNNQNNLKNLAYKENNQNNLPILNNGLEENKMKKALIIVGKNTQDHEFIYPFYRAQEAGFEVDVATRNKETVKCIIGTTITPTRDIAGIKVDNYDLLILPGGAKAMEYLRQDIEVIEFIRDFNASGKPIASICHAAQLLISAGIVRGRKISGYYSIKDDITNAGGIYVDEPAVIDKNIISTAHYKDLGPWMKATLEVFDLSQ